MSLRKLSNASRSSIGLRSIFVSWLAIAAVVGGLLVPFNSTNVANAQPTAGFSNAVFKKKPTPIIVGVPEVGSWLTVVTGTWDPGTSLGIQWTRNNSYDIKGQNKTRYLVTSADVGKSLTVSVTGMKKGYLVHKATSAEVFPYAKGAAPSPAPSGKPSSNPSPTPPPNAALGKLVNTPIPTIVGNPVVGSELQALAGNWDSGVQVSYQWFRGSVPILGATGAKYVVVGPDSGSSLKVVTTGSKANFTSVERTSAPTRVVTTGTTVLQDIQQSAKPLVKGSAQVGQSLSLDTGSWAPGVSLSIQWLRNGQPILGASSTSYKLLPIDFSARISASVTGSMAGYKSLTLVSDLSAEVAAATFSDIGTPLITGTNSVGSTLALVPGLWDKSAKLAIKWLVNGTPVTGETGTTYILRAADLGKTVSATITATALGYRTETKVVSTSTLVSTGSISPAPTPIISGTNSVGSILTANPGVWLQGVSLSYQWERDGTPIAAATGTTYRILASDVGATLSVTVTGSKAGFQTVTKSGTYTGQVPSSSFQSTPAPDLVWNLRTYSVGPGLYWDEGTTFSYQWLRNGVAIPNATLTSYVATDQDAGQKLSLSVTGSKPGFVSVTKVSAAVTVPLFTFTKYLTEIRGDFEVGNTVGAFPDWDAGTTISLQWTRDGVPIVGATQSLYLITSDDGGHKIGLTITGSKPGYRTMTNSIVEKPVKRLMVWSKPFITGGTNYFSTLTANLGVWEDGVRFLYNWYMRYEAPESIGASMAYPTEHVFSGVKEVTPVSTSYGKYFFVCVDGIKAGLRTVTTCSDWFGPMQNNIFPNQPPVKIVGTPGKGATLSVDTSGWLPGSKFTYSWSYILDGKRYSGGSSTTWSSWDSSWWGYQSRKIQLKLVVSKDGYETVTMYSDELSF